MRFASKFDKLNHGGFLVIVARLINFCWFCFKWGLVLGVIGGIAAIPFLYRQVDVQICRRFENLLAQHYPGLKVAVRSAEFVAGEGIKVHGVSIVEPSAEGPRAELLSIEELFLSTKTELKDLLLHDPVITQVAVRRPVLRVTRRLDGKWSAAKLFPPPKFGDHPPQVTVENGTIEIFDPTKNPSGTLTLRDVNLSIQPSSETAPGGALREIRNLQGMLTCDYFRRVEFQGTVDPQSGAFTLKGSTQRLDISPELRDALPQPLCSQMHAWGELRAEGKFDFQIAYDPSRARPFSFSIGGAINRGQINDPRCPHPLTEVRATFRADNTGFIIDDLSAKCNEALIQKLSFQCAGYDADSPKTIKAQVRQLELDHQLLAFLPPLLQKKWDDYQPCGKIDAELNLEFDGYAWRPEISVRCLNVSFKHVKFPYTLERGQGLLELKNDRLTLDVTAFSGNRPIHLTAEFLHPTTEPVEPNGGPVGWFKAEGKELPLDESIFKAIQAQHEKAADVVRQLNPRGTVNFTYSSVREAPDAAPYHHLKVDLNRCSICYEKFPYPVNNIVGQLEMFENQWDFHDLEGNNNTVRITGGGSFRTSIMEGNRLELQLTGKDMPLENQLRDALPPKIRRMWEELKPNGVIDLETNISYLAEKKQLNVGVHAAPQKGTTSIEPAFFPYRMDNLQGDLYYRDGHVTLEKIRAKHGPVELATEGICDFQPTGPWEIHFKGLTIDRLDRDLIQALPERLKKAVLALNPSGTVNVGGNLDFSQNGIPGDPLQSRWDMNINLFQNALQCGIKLDNLCGNVSLSGQCDGRRVGCRGEIALDSVNFKEYQFTKVSGPLWIDDDRVLFGSWVDERKQNNPPPSANPPRQPRPLSANLFDGVVHGDGWVALGAEPRYGLSAELLQADVRKVIEGRQNLQGRIDATIGLQGTGASHNAMSGRGSIRLSDAYVYELPGMVRMLKLLSLRAPDRNAFSNMDIAYRIEGEHIYFDPINFHGDAISLLGSGEMDWQSNLNVNFRAVVGRAEPQIPFIKEMFSGASRGAMLVRVRGTLQTPDISSEALPAVNQALQQLQEKRK